MLTKILVIGFYACVCFAYPYAEVVGPEEQVLWAIGYLAALFTFGSLCGVATKLSRG